MKTLLAIALTCLATIMAGSCRKDAQVSVETNDTIIGTWELRQTVGNMGTINYPPGNGSIVEFNDSSFSTSSPKDHIFLQGPGPAHGVYRIVPDSTVNAATGLLMPAGQFTNRLVLNGNEAADKLFFHLSGSKLIVVSGYFPTDAGFEKTYQKQ